MKKKKKYKWFNINLDFLYSFFIIYFICVGIKS